MLPRFPGMSFFFSCFPQLHCLASSLVVITLPRTCMHDYQSGPPSRTYSSSIVRASRGSWLLQSSRCIVEKCPAGHHSRSERENWRSRMRCRRFTVKIRFGHLCREQVQSPASQRLGRAFLNLTPLLSKVHGFSVSAFLTLTSVEP